MEFSGAGERAQLKVLRALEDLAWFPAPRWCSVELQFQEIWGPLLDYIGTNRAFMGAHACMRAKHRHKRIFFFFFLVKLIFHKIRSPSGFLQLLVCPWILLLSESQALCLPLYRSSSREGRSGCVGVGPMQTDTQVLCLESLSSPTALLLLSWNLNLGIKDSAFLF